MLDNCSTASDSLRISSDLIHSQSQDPHYSINVKGKIRKFHLAPMSFSHDSKRRGILQQQSLGRNYSLAHLLNTLPSFSLLQRADNPLATASGQFQHTSMFLQLTCKCPNKNKLPHTHGGLRYKKQDSLKSFPGGRNQQSSIQEN